MALVSKPFADIITFTRASTATYFDSAGTLQSAAIDVPRFDYDPATLAARGFLIEEARTNLEQYSEDFTNVFWTASNATVSSNTAVAPNGTTTADKLVTDNTLTGGQVFATTTMAASTAFAFSIFAKASEWSWTRLTTRGPENSDIGAYFNLSTGVVGTVDAGVTASIQAVGSGWYRCTIVRTTGTGAAGTRQRVYSTNADNTLSTGNGTSGIFIWGAQLEAAAATINSGTASGTTTAVVLSAGSATDDIYNGNVLFVNGEYRVITDYVGSTKTATVAALTATPSGAYVVTGGNAAFATSYIPTTTTALTRAADVASVNTLSPWFNATEGTLFAEARPLVAPLPVAGVPTSFVSINNEIALRFRPTQKGGASVIASSVVQVDTSSTGNYTTGNNKLAFAYAANNFASSLNGESAVIDTSGTVPTVTSMSIGSLSGVANWTNGYLRRITYYPRKLSSAELQAITA